MEIVPLHVDENNVHPVVFLAFSLQDSVYSWFLSVVIDSLIPVSSWLGNGVRLNNRLVPCKFLFLLSYLFLSQ